MKPSQRYVWIADYIRQHGAMDVLNAAFVDAYVEATGCKVRVMNYGANKCYQLGQDLKAMYLQRYLDRSTASIVGLAGMGFPRWIYSYTLVYHPLTC